MRLYDLDELERLRELWAHSWSEWEYETEAVAMCPAMIRDLRILAELRKMENEYENDEHWWVLGTIIANAERRVAEQGNGD